MSLLEWKCRGAGDADPFNKFPKMLVVTFKFLWSKNSLLMNEVLQFWKNGDEESFGGTSFGNIVDPDKVENGLGDGAIINKLRLWFNLSMGLVMSYFLEMM